MYVAPSIKPLPTMQETWVQFLAREVPLEKEMATHFSIPHGQRSLAGYCPWDRKSWTRLSAIFLSSFLYGCECWTVKKAECQRIDDFKLWCWKKLSRVPWTARRSNQSILQKINPECSLEGLMLKLKHPYFDHLMRRANSWEKTLMLGNTEGKRRGWQRCLDEMVR